MLCYCVIISCGLAENLGLFLEQEYQRVKKYFVELLVNCGSNVVFQPKKHFHHFIFKMFCVLKNMQNSFWLYVSFKLV